MELNLGKCLACDVDLEEVFPDSTRHHQFKDAIDLTFHGGYGEKIDGNRPLRFSLCGLCGDRFFNLFPGVHKILLELSLQEESDGSPIRGAYRN